MVENSGTVERKEAICVGGRKPQKPEKGVRATAISGCRMDVSACSRVEEIKSYLVIRICTKGRQQGLGQDDNGDYLCRFRDDQNEVVSPVAYQDELVYSAPYE